MNQWRYTYIMIGYGGPFHMTFSAMMSPRSLNHPKSIRKGELSREIKLSYTCYSKDYHYNGSQAYHRGPIRQQQLQCSVKSDGCIHIKDTVLKPIPITLDQPHVVFYTGLISRRVVLLGNKVFFIFIVLTKYFQLIHNNNYKSNQINPGS